MTNRQNAKFNMFILVANMVEAPNNGLQTAMPQLAANLGALAALVPLIDAAGAQQELHRYSAKASKAACKKALCADTMRAVRAIQAYAEVSEQPDLQSQFDCTKSGLQAAKDQLLIEIAANVQAFAIENEALLAPFNYSKGNNNALSESLALFRGIVTSPKLNQLARIEASRKLKELFTQVQALLKKCDKLAETLIDVDNDLYAQYKQRRILPNAVSRHYQVTGKVTDTAGNPLKNVTITIDGLPNKGKTAAKGGFRFPSLPDGVHTLRCARPGYQDLLKVISVTHGLRQSLNLEMREI